MLTSLLTEANVLDALREVDDPELGLNVVDLGLIYGIAIEGNDVRVMMTLTTQGCPLHESLSEATEEAIKLMVPGVRSVVVDLVWEPAWTADRISPAGRKALGWE